MDYLFGVLNNPDYLFMPLIILIFPLQIFVFNLESTVLLRAKDDLWRYFILRSNAYRLERLKTISFADEAFASAIVQF